MPESTNKNPVFYFGLYELDGSSGELRKDGKARPRLQGQPLEVLLQLLNRPGEVVTREELRQRLWPADTFVDYDHSLNAAVNKLRDALSDSAENPRFIQTIPRRGYQFIASVKTPSVAATPSKQADGGKSIPEPFVPEELPSGLLSDPRELPFVARSTVRLLFSLIQVMYLAFYVLSLAQIHRMQGVLEQVTRFPGVFFAFLILTAVAGIPVRLYLLSAAAFGYSGLPGKFLRLFPFLLPLDELWALAPFLLVNEIGMGLALAATAALLYVPFSQRSLLLMKDGKAP